jgi:ADP-L-glycero-D-manno-heptose 6-epimerase
VIVITGGFGFIGSNLVRALNARGRSDILVVDDLSDGRKSLNLADCQISDYLDSRESLQKLDSARGFGADVEVIYHLGACSDTTQWDGRLMMEQNFRYSKAVLDYSIATRTPFVYASSAAVYGKSRKFAEVGSNEKPLNMYGYSKLAFDQHVRSKQKSFNSTVIGLRYFNVFGMGESHKLKMASVIWHFYNQLAGSGLLRLFGASHGYSAGEQRRDFISVDDVVKVTLWASIQSPDASGIYNCGTGNSLSFNEVAGQIIKSEGKGEIEYVEFPEELENAYQAFTEADLSSLRRAGYNESFSNPLEEIKEYVRCLAS